MERRDFLWKLPSCLLGLVSILIKPDLVSARQRNLADFLQAFSPVYDENTEWDFGSGRLLCGINGYYGNLLIYVDDVWVSHSVDNSTFDASRQRIRIMRGNQRIFDYDPRLRTSPQPLH